MSSLLENDYTIENEVIKYLPTFVAHKALVDSSKKRKTAIDNTLSFPISKSSKKICRYCARTIYTTWTQNSIRRKWKGLRNLLFKFDSNTTVYRNKRTVRILNYLHNLTPSPPSPTKRITSVKNNGTLFCKEEWTGFSPYQDVMTIYLHSNEKTDHN